MFDELMKLLAGKVAKELLAQFKRIKQKLEETEKEPGQDFWHDENDRFKFVQGILADAVKDSINSLATSLGFKVNPADVNAHVLEWVQNYSFELIKDLNETTREKVEEAISDFVGIPGFTMQDVFDLIEPTFGAARAENIGVTEITRAYGAGTNITKDALYQQGVITERVWMTDNDDLVCEICEPNHELKESDGWSVSDVPGHPRCRCRTTLTLVNIKAYVTREEFEEFKKTFQSEE